MIKKLAVFSIVISLCVVGLMLVNGCDEEATATDKTAQAVCEKKAPPTCTKTVDVSQKDACSSIKNTDACSVDCKKDCCLAKQKAGTCPSQINKTGCPKQG